MHYSAVIPKIDATKETEKIIKILNLELSKYMKNIYIRPVYNNKAIEVSGFYKEDELRIWIRLSWKEEPPKYKLRCSIGISSIQLPLELQHKGIFTSIVNKLSKLRFTEAIEIMSVCTPEMNNWCIKHNLHTVDNLNYIIYCKN